MQPRFDLTREATLPPIKLLNSKIEDSFNTFDNSDTNRTAETEYVSTSVLKDNKYSRKASKQSDKYKPETPKSAKNPYKISHVVIDILDEGSIFVKYYNFY